MPAPVPKTIFVNQKVEDLWGLVMDLRRASFKVRNVGADLRGTYVHLEPDEDKDPTPIVKAWVGKQAPKSTPLVKDLRLKELSKVQEEEQVRRQTEEAARQKALPKICVQMGGGLGDIFNWLFMHEMYATLGKLPSEEKALIILTCGNPGAQELFRWHPKASQFEVHNLGFMMPAEYEPIKKRNGWPENTPSAYFPQQNVQFYPGPSDEQPLRELKPLKYIVVNPAAGHPGRSIPASVYNDAIDAILTYGRQRYGLNVVVVGRTYDSNNDPAHNHVEPKIKPRDGLIDLIDKVSVPATLEIIRNSVGVICCHSAVCLASWYMKKPSLLLYKKDLGDTQINIELKSPYNFGRDFPTTRHTDFSAYNRSFMQEFLDMSVRNHLEGRTSA